MKAFSYSRGVFQLGAQGSVLSALALTAIFSARLLAQGESSPIARPLAPISAAEMVPTAPSPQHQWLAAGWSWQHGQYMWITGHWELPPVPNATWSPSRWDLRPQGYVLVNGSWQSTVYAPPLPPPAPATVTITAGIAPPPPASDIILQRPGAGYVWTPGFWTWTGGRYVWTGGQWTLPPQPRASWVQPRWEQRGAEYVFVPGYWQGGEAALQAPPPPASVSVEVEPAAPPPPGPPELYVRGGPPPPRREYIGPRPSPYHIWINGYWRWRGGRYAWVDGRWELPPRGRVWVEPRWEHRDNGYIFIEGSWR